MLVGRLAIVIRSAIATTDSTRRSPAAAPGVGPGTAAVSRKRNPSGANRESQAARFTVGFIALCLIVPVRAAGPPMSTSPDVHGQHLLRTRAASHPHGRLHHAPATECFSAAAGWLSTPGVQARRGRVRRVLTALVARRRQPAPDRHSHFDHRSIRRRGRISPALASSGRHLLQAMAESTRPNGTRGRWRDDFLQKV
jgi:hypothetical protein